MNELNSNWVLWASIGVVVISIIVFIVYSWKIARAAMEDFEKDENSKD